MARGPLFLGIDLGSSGIRGIVARADGRVAAAARLSLDGRTADPDHWWRVLRKTTQALMQDLGRGQAHLKAISVTSTSGTLVCADADGRALAPAIMYNDARARMEAKSLEAVSHGLPYAFAPSFSLPKALWVQCQRPALYERTRRLCHPADWLVGRLTGTFMSDYSNALKMGFDLEREDWPQWIDASIRDRLPVVVAPGAVVGRVSGVASQETALRSGLTVVAGATDGVAGAVASGLRRVGDYNTALGTTLIFKGLSSTAVRGRNLYSHKLPGGRWLPGAASNTGAGWIREWFAGEDPRVLDRRAEALLPSPYVSYPLARQGERFPFADGRMRGFASPDGDRLARYASCLQGTALLERMAYEVLDRAAGTSGGAVYATGGGSRSDIWMQCRADVCQRPMHRAACPEAAMGAAILAAAGTEAQTLAMAMDRMSRTDRSFEPVYHAVYDEAYAQFVEMLSVRRSQDDV